MAATPISLPAQAQRQCTGRFDYALPATLRFDSGQQSLYGIAVDVELAPPGTPADVTLKQRLQSILAERGPPGAAVRQFDLAGVGPAAWMMLVPTRPNLVTLLAMKAVPASDAVLFLRFEPSTGREAVVERLRQVRGHMEGRHATGLLCRPGRVRHCAKHDRESPGLLRRSQPGTDRLRMDRGTHAVAGRDAGRAPHLLVGVPGSTCPRRCYSPALHGDGHAWPRRGTRCRVERLAGIVAPASHRRALSVSKLKITTEQMRLLGASMRRQFEIDAIAMLRQSSPETTAKPANDALRLLVRRGIERARRTA
jgi:hypothetical protein